VSSELLRQRAQRLATPVSSDVARREDLLVFGAGTERYAVRLEFVRGVVEDRVTPMPGVSAWIAGALNVRGSLVGVIDLTRALNLSAARNEALNVVLLESKFGVVGVRVTGRPELRSTLETEVDFAVSGQPGVRAIVAGTIALLNVNEWLESLSTR
jgi:chemotaxis signal transduction protein